MATVTAFETHRHFLGVVRLDLELPDCIAGILEELHLCEGCARARRCSAVVWDNSALARSSSTRPRFCSRFARSPSAISRASSASTRVLGRSIGHLSLPTHLTNRPPTVSSSERFLPLRRMS